MIAWLELTLRMITVPRIDITINNKAVHTAANADAISTPSVIDFDILDAATHATIKHMNTST